MFLDLLGFGLLCDVGGLCDVGLLWVRIFCGFSALSGIFCLCGFCWILFDI